MGDTVAKIESAIETVYEQISNTDQRADQVFESNAKIQRAATLATTDTISPLSPNGMPQTLVHEYESHLNSSFRTNGQETFLTLHKAEYLKYKHFEHHPELCPAQGYQWVYFNGPAIVNINAQDKFAFDESQFTEVVSYLHSHGKNRVYTDIYDMLSSTHNMDTGVYAALVREQDLRCDKDKCYLQQLAMDNIFCCLPRLPVADGPSMSDEVDNKDFNPTYLHSMESKPNNGPSIK